MNVGGNMRVARVASVVSVEEKTAIFGEASASLILKAPHAIPCLHIHSPCAGASVGVPLSLSPVRLKRMS
jgi:hypothetical protein